MIKIAPSILSADFSAMGQAVELMQASGADYIHCDVMDGVFVPNITFGPPMIKSIKKHADIPLDVHLMIDRPERYIDAFADAGADIITIHAEATLHAERTLAYIKTKGIKAGIVLNPATPENAAEYVMHLADMILLMSVNPGFGGQKFIPAVLPKVERVRNMIEKSGRDIELEIDGGVNFDNIGEIINAGANVIVAGNTVFSAPDPAEAISRLENRQVTAFIFPAYYISVGAFTPHAIERQGIMVAGFAGKRRQDYQPNIDFAGRDYSNLLRSVWMWLTLLGIALIVFGAVLARRGMD